MSAAPTTGDHGRRPTGRQRRAGARERRPGTAALVLLAVAIAVTLLLALSARTVVARSWCANHPVGITVAASGEIAPAIRQFGNYFNRQHRDVDGHCASVSVVAAAPGAVAGQLAGGGATGIDAWIPDSPLWAELARSTRAGAQRVRGTVASIAESPLVIVMPRSAAARMPAFGSSVSWRFLLPPESGGPASTLGVHVQFPDPTQAGAGLASLIELRRLLRDGIAARTGLTRFVLHAQLVPTPGGSAPLAALAAPRPSSGAPSEPVTVLGEQQVIQFDQAHPQQPLAVRYPAEGTDELAFPYLTTTTSRLAADVAAQFGRLLATPYATSYLRFEGFRVAGRLAGQWPAWYGLGASPPALLPAPTAADAAAALQAWRRLTLGARDLALIDVSSAMAARPAPGAPTLEQMLGSAAGVGLARFPDSTQLGVWAFASRLNGSLPYRQLLPIGPLPGSFGLVSRRQEILRLTQSQRALPSTPADLYSAILAGYRQMTATYQPRYENTLIVLTAGVDAPSGDLAPDAVVQVLRSLYNPHRPVVIVAIMIGRAGDFRALQRIAAVTGGQATEITQPSQIGRFFYRAMAQRICRPRCGG